MPGVLSKLAYEYNSEEKEEEEKYRFKILSRIIKDDPTQINVRDSDGNTPLMKLCVNFPHEYNNIKMLLDNGACPNIPNNKGNLPYTFLKNNGYDRESRLLLDYGSKTGMVLNYNSSSSNKYKGRCNLEGQNVENEKKNMEIIISQYISKYGRGKGKVKIIRYHGKK
tara:strand:- start:79 stop:579 length:501 start_codon:yes stop_codon:yes gene_type:complete